LGLDVCTFFDCGWYLDYPKDTTPLIESGFKEKNNPSFLAPCTFKELGYHCEKEEIGK
jgi:hypothetical protein